MSGTFSEPTSESLRALRGKIQPAHGNLRNDCDTGVCSSCNCNCDDTYGIRAKRVLTQKRHP